MTEDQPHILMYHGVVSEWSESPCERGAGAELYDVPVSNFKSQMQWLKENGYAVTTFTEHGLGSGAPMSKQVILTFDDGEMNNYEKALPILQKYDFSAYFFIVANFVGQPGYMGWEELKKLRDAGVIIGSHGFSHEILINLLDTQIGEELRASKKYLELNLDIKIDSLSIPRGFCNEKIIRMAHATGYQRVFISDWAGDIQSECYSRMAVKSNWPLKRFEQAMTGDIPLREKVFIMIKNFFKRLLGGGGYNWIRKMMLKIK